MSIYKNGRPSKSGYRKNTIVLKDTKRFEYVWNGTEETRIHRIGWIGIRNCRKKQGARNGKELC